MPRAECGRRRVRGVHPCSEHRDVPMWKYSTSVDPTDHRTQIYYEMHGSQRMNGLHPVSRRCIETNNPSAWGYNHATLTTKNRILRTEHGTMHRPQHAKISIRLDPSPENPLNGAGIRSIRLVDRYDPSSLPFPRPPSHHYFHPDQPDRTRIPSSLVQHHPLLQM